MPAVFFAGKSAHAKLALVTYYADKWSAEIEADEIEVTNFESPVSGGASWREYLGGFTAGNITLEGPHDPTLAIPIQGAATTYDLTIGGVYKITGSGIVKKTSYSTDIKGAARFSFALRMTGAPTFTVALARGTDAEGRDSVPSTEGEAAPEGESETSEVEPREGTDAEGRDSGPSMERERERTPLEEPA